MFLVMMNLGGTNNMKGSNNAYRQAMKDISKTSTVLINTDVDPFKGSYSRLNRNIVDRGYTSYRKK